MQKNTNHKLCQFIIKKYINQKVDWPREIKIAQKLIKTYKGYSFWNGLKPANLPSLAFFLTEDGKKFIAMEKIKDNLELDKPIKFEIQEIKIGEDKKVCKKPKSLLEFINYGKKT
jgi:hypothetical protein